MKSEDLQEFGLSNTEAKVYLALIQLNRSQAGEITKRSGVNRTNVYDALERLIEKGLVSYVTENNKKVFEAVGPDRFGLVIQEKQEKLLEVIKELKSNQPNKQSKENASIFRGKMGIKTIFEDMLKERKELLVYGAESKFRDMFPYYQKHWNDERARLGLGLKIIWNEKVKEIKKKEHLKLIEMRFLPESYDFPSTNFIYSDRVVTIVWTENPLAFMIVSKDIVKSNTHFFNILWKIAKA